MITLNHNKIFIIISTLSFLLIIHLLNGSFPIVTASTDDQSPLIGINMRGYFTNMPEHREIKAPFPSNYYDFSFKTFSDADIDFVRYLLYWESFEKNPISFLNELKSVAETADKYNIKIIYVNDKSRTSSWFDKHSTGFPSFLYKNNPFYKQGSGDNYNDQSLPVKEWWDKWWDKKIVLNNGINGWALQVNFFNHVVHKVNNHQSTLGYEILNDPYIYNSSQWEKIGEYNTFIVNELRKVTQKTIFFDRQVPSSKLYGPIKISAENIAKMAPVNKTNLIFKTTLYNEPQSASFGDKIQLFSMASKLSKVPICFCEFNLKPIPSYAKPSENEILNVTISDKIMEKFFLKFNQFDAWGWAIWLWTFEKRTNPNYNLIVNENGILKTTKIFEDYRKTIQDFKNNPQKYKMDIDPFFPVAGIVDVNVIPSKDKISVNGEAFDIHSGIKSIMVKIDKSSYNAPQINLTDHFIKWNITLPFDNILENHQIILKLEDNFGYKSYYTYKGPLKNTLVN